MGLFRLLALIFIVWLVIHFAKRLLATGKRTATPGKKEVIANMVRCEFCGLHIPEKEAIQTGEQYFCSKAHRDQYDE